MILQAQTHKQFSHNFKFNSFSWHSAPQCSLVCQLEQRW